MNFIQNLLIIQLYCLYLHWINHPPPAKASPDSFPLVLGQGLPYVKSLIFIYSFLSLISIYG